MRVTAACAHDHHRECDKIRCSEAVDVGNNELITVCLSVRIRVDRDEDLKLASPPFNVTRRDSNVINNGRIVASTRNMTSTSQTALENSSNKLQATHASPNCARTPLSNCTNQHCSFKLLLGATCYSSALDADAFVPVMVERERAIAESDAKHLLGNLISSA
jgi:hypothetical protein